MRLSKYGKILHKDVIKLGQGSITRYTLFEIKHLFGIIINVFNTTEQDRFHTHAFNSISVMIRGYYWEDSLSKQRIQQQKECIDSPSIRFISKKHNHRILESSKNAISITLMGPWNKTWTETRCYDRRSTKFTWGRQRIN